MSGTRSRAQKSKLLPALHHACERGSVAELSQLLSISDYNVNEKGPSDFTPLHIAAKEGNTSCVVLLLDYGANLGAKSSLGQTPLFLAVQNGHYDIVRRLLINRASATAQDDEGWTCLHHAVMAGEKSIVTLLVLKQPLCVNIQNDKGNTALHLAAQNGRVEIAEKLVVEGNADTTLKNKVGKTALGLARLKKIRDILCLSSREIRKRRAVALKENSLSEPDSTIVAGDRALVHHLAQKGGPFFRFSIMYYSRQRSCIIFSADIYVKTNEWYSIRK
eukprot:GCRY01007614.1.p1 GENE.GCRY01007614.1~~GCRY01007614.1.p1  ORF type:complete len:276 (+),score=23.74 GCRY01007614.1:129-956(+)